MMNHPRNPSERISFQAKASANEYLIEAYEILQRVDGLQKMPEAELLEKYSGFIHTWMMACFAAETNYLSTGEFEGSLQHEQRELAYAQQRLAEVQLEIAELELEKLKD